MQIAFHTSGCKLNFAESSSIRRIAEDSGFKIVPFEEEADVYIINTCTVTEKSDKKCRNAIRKAINRNPNGKVIVTGCYAGLNPSDIEKIEGVSSIIGNEGKASFENILLSLKENKEIVPQSPSEGNPFFNAYSLGERTRSFLKVQDGCNYGCSYCTIPLARGYSRNAPVDQIVDEARHIASKGIKEIVITGINVGDFGRSTGQSFFELLTEIEKTEGIERFRISSVEPDLLSEEIIRFVADSPKFTHHFHIPLQSGCNTILNKMKRKYTVKEFYDKISLINKVIPDTCIGTDVIVGFPGESGKDFETTRHFVNELDISYMHVFSYSERPGTLSTNLPEKISPTEKESRNSILRQLSVQKKKNFYNRFANHTMSVLFESKEKNGLISGFTGNYIKTEIRESKTVINKILPVKLSEFNEKTFSMTGTLIN